MTHCFCSPPSAEVSALSVEAKVKGESKGSLKLAHPNLLPAADQSFDERGSVTYSLRAWPVKLPWNWVEPGMELIFTDDSGATGSISQIDVADPKEIVINNIRLGMLTEAPVSDKQRFIADPANGATDYFQTVPVSKMTMAQYETVELDKVIVANGSIYTKDNPDPSQAGVYAGTMRENVGKAQVSTGINLATWGITSSKMSQVQPGSTNQRVIHHSAGFYGGGQGRVEHGLSGGNGMATLYTSVGNELSHELGHSYGLGHFPGTNNNAQGDDKIRNAVHNMDSGWGYISYRNSMRSNLDLRAYKETAQINGYAFGENLAGKYNFNNDAMSGGWDASEVSDYTHHTSWSLKRIQDNLKDLVADTSYPSGYRDWDEDNGVWADAKELNPDFNMLKPKSVGGNVFTLLGGYNPADPAQTVLYPAFRSNYGVTFDLPQAKTAGNLDERQCWLQVDFASKATQYISLDASAGVKQLNVKISEDDKPTSAQVSCRSGEQTTALGNKISIATDLKPMPSAVVVGQESGYKTLRAEELAALDPKLVGLADDPSAVLPSADMLKLSGWSDDLSALSPTARQTAERMLGLLADAKDIQAYLNEHSESMVNGSRTARDVLVKFLEARGYTESDGSILPAGSPVTVDRGKCAYVGLNDGKPILMVDNDIKNCATAHDDTWYQDTSGRIHSVNVADGCLSAGTPVKLIKCSTSSADQRWIVNANSTVVRASNLKSALDLNRNAGYAVLYGLTGTTNQAWATFPKSSNPLLSVLDGDTLESFMKALDESNLNNPDPDPTEEETAPPTESPEASAPETTEPEKTTDPEPEQSAEESEAPESSESESTEPEETTVPESSQSSEESQAPESSAPESSEPEATESEESKSPESSAPDSSVPEQTEKPQASPEASQSDDAQAPEQEIEPPYEEPAPVPDGETEGDEDHVGHEHEGDNPDEAPQSEAPAATEAPDAPDAEAKPDSSETPVAGADENNGDNEDPNYEDNAEESKGDESSDSDGSPQSEAPVTGPEENNDNNVESIEVAPDEGAATNAPATKNAAEHVEEDAGKKSADTAKDPQEADSLASTGAAITGITLAALALLGLGVVLGARKRRNV